MEEFDCELLWGKSPMLSIKRCRKCCINKMKKRCGAELGEYKAVGGYSRNILWNESSGDGAWQKC